MVAKSTAYLCTYTEALTLLPSHHWAQNFTVENEDIEQLVNILLERETPLSSEALAHIMVSQRLQAEADKLEARYKDVVVYNPAQHYEIGQKLLFPVFDFATGTVTAIRDGDNNEYGTFRVATVVFDDTDETEPGAKPREFAIALEAPHKLSQTDNGNGAIPGLDALTADEIMDVGGGEIIQRLESRLQQNDDLVVVAQKWFPQELMLQADEGHLNLAEAVLDINGGGPMKTSEILEQIGGLGNAPESLQVFSMNFILNADDRFDEVGPSGEVLWYLNRMEPEQVRITPSILQYTPIDHDRSILADDQISLEHDLGDEHSELSFHEDLAEANVTLIYPHRRAGTLPLNARTVKIFPTARRTPRVWITLVDGQDDTEYQGWVVRNERYVYGLGELYRKYSLPIGAYVTVSRMDAPGKIRVDFSAYRPRTEWVRLATPKGEQLGFENSKRAIGADYDDLMILGIDDLQALDDIVSKMRGNKRSLAAIMRMLIPDLGRLSPQGTVHAKTIYSAVNVLRRCPPGPILATLAANPDFENVGGHYWKLAEA